MREVMVTRTVIGTKATVLCLNTETAEPYNKEVVLSGEFKDASKMLTAAAKLIDDDENKAVKVVAYEKVMKRYGMPLDAFIEASEELPLLTKNEDEDSAFNGYEE